MSIRVGMDTGMEHDIGTKNVSVSWSEDGPGFGQQFLHRTAHILDVLHVWLLWLLVSEFNIGQPRYSFFNHTGMMGNGECYC